MHAIEMPNTLEKERGERESNRFLYDFTHDYTECLVYKTILIIPHTHTYICRNRFLFPPTVCADCCPGPDSMDAAVCHCVDLRRDWIEWMFGEKSTARRLTNITGRIQIMIEWPAGTTLAIQIIGRPKSAMIVRCRATIVMGLPYRRQGTTTVNIVIWLAVMPGHHNLKLNSFLMK